MKIDVKINLFDLITMNRMWSSYNFEVGNYLDDLEKSICIKLQKDFINKQASRIGKIDKKFTISLFKHEALVLEKYIRNYNRHCWQPTDLERSRTQSIISEIQQKLL